MDDGRLDRLHDFVAMAVAREARDSLGAYIADFGDPRPDPERRNRLRLAAVTAAEAAADYLSGRVCLIALEDYRRLSALEDQGSSTK